MHHPVFTFRVGVLTASVALGGCSFVLVDSAPPRDQWPATNERGVAHQYCTSLPMPPIMDAVVAAGIGAATVYAVESTPHNYDGLPRGMIGILAVPFA